jgi:tetratricopeptide (TPR) repeat protein
VDGRNATLNSTLSVAELVADAVRHLGVDDAEAALAALAAAGDREPDNLRLHFASALAAWHLGDVAQALSLAQSCFDRDPGNGTVAEVVASLYAQSGELLDSLYYGKLATALGPEPSMHNWIPPSFPSFGRAFLTIREKPLLAQSRLLLAGGKRVQALDKARQHVQVAQADVEGREFYAELLLQAGQAALAAETLAPLISGDEPAPDIASLMARSLAAVGEADAAANGHERACAAAPGDAVIAAARIADAPWLGAEARQRDAWVTDWVSRFAPPGKARHWRRPGETLVVGYLVPHLADRSDAAAVAAVARAHRRRGTRVIGYGLGAQSWDDNAALRGGFDKWRDITRVDHATLAKMLAGDNLDVVIDVGGFAAPDTLRALARVNSAVRTAWLVDPRGLEHRIYDAAIVPRSARAGASEMVLWQSPCGTYPLLRDWTRRRQRIADGTCRFGADVQLAQIDPPTTALWRSVLTAAPAAVLLLRGNDLDYGANVPRLVERFGDLAGRIDVVATGEADEFYRQVDVALTPERGPSARMAGEALACGVPVLALEGEGAMHPYAALLRDLGLATLVAATAADYVGLAAGLAASPEQRTRAAAAVEAVAARGEDTAAAIAGAIEEAARAMLGQAAA